MMVMTVIRAITSALGFGAPHRYVDGREVPNFRKGETMKTKKPEPKEKGEQKRQREQKRQHQPKY